MKRAYIFYRGSDNSQSNEISIATQKAVCRDYANTRGWKIVKEFTEPVIATVTGSTDPGALQTIKNNASKGLYDVLLVYKYDILGRDKDESPFVVEGLSRYGIETWSVLEGSKRFAEHIERLIKETFGKMINKDKPLYVESTCNQ